MCLFLGSTQVLSLVASPKRNAKVVSQDMRWSILCSLQGKSTSKTRRRSIPSSCKKPTWGSAQWAQGGTELSHSPLHPGSTMKWVISFRERERNTHKAELLKNPRWRQSMAQAVCAQGQMDWTDNATLEVGWHFCASVYPVVKWGDKTGPNLQEVKGRKLHIQSVWFYLENRKRSVMTPLQNASHPRQFTNQKWQWPLRIL